MDDLERPASAAQIARMRELADEALASGAIGVSTGLYYEPAAAAPTQEVIDVCRPLSRRNGLYCTHMRDEADNVLESLEETFRIGRDLGVPVVVSPHRWWARRTAAARKDCAVEASMREQNRPGLHPYCASSTILTASRVGVASKVLVTWSKPHPEFAGMELAEIGRRWA